MLTDASDRGRKSAVLRLDAHGKLRGQRKVSNRGELSLQYAICYVSVSILCVFLASKYNRFFGSCLFLEKGQFLLCTIKKLTKMAVN